MPNKGPLDMSQFVDEDIDTEYQVEIVKPSEPKQQLEIPPERPENKKYHRLADDELDEELRKFKGYLQNLTGLKDPGKLEKVIEDLTKEKLFREWEKKKKKQVKGNQEAKLSVNGDNGRPKSTRVSTPNYKNVNDFFAKTDGSGSQSKGYATNGAAFSEECVLLNPSKGKGPFTQRSPNTEGSTLDGGSDTSRIFSSNRAGPSPRPGLRSGSKLCGQCGESRPDSSFCTCRFYGKQHKPYFAAKESPKRNSLPGPGRKGNGVKRARQGVGGGDSPEKVVELFSSEDEEVKVTQDTFADCQIASQRKVYGTRSSLSPSLEGVRIAYPSRDDPEAVEVASHDLHRLEPMEFLNDTVIDFYIKYIQRPEVLTVEDKNRFYFFNSFFYKKLHDVVGGQNKKTVADLSKLRKWTRRTNIFEKEYLFVPIHDKWHWSLAIVCHPGATSEDTGRQKCILHLDSMSPGHKSNNVFRLLRTYLIAEWEHQADKDGVGDSFVKFSNEDFTSRKIPVPQQENESDCGLFLLHYIERFLKDAPSSFKLSDVDQGKLFGRNWFKPSQASGLREKIQQLLKTKFKEEASRSKENVETIERSLQHHESENILRNYIQHVNHPDVEVVKASCSPRQYLAAELVREHNTPAACNVDSSGCSTPVGLPVECAEQHLDANLGRIDEDIRACSQANCLDPRESTELPPASMLESSADFVSCDYLGARRRPSSRVSMDDTEKVKMPYQPNSRERDLGDDDQSGIPLVVDLPIQEEQCSAD